MNQTNIPGNHQCIAFRVCEGCKNRYCSVCGPCMCDNQTCNYCSQRSCWSTYCRKCSNAMCHDCVRFMKVRHETSNSITLKTDIVCPICCVALTCCNCGQTAMTDCYNCNNYLCGKCYTKDMYCNNCYKPTFCPILNHKIFYSRHRCPECYNVFIDKKMRKHLLVVFAGLKKNKLPTLVIVKILSNLTTYDTEN